MARDEYRRQQEREDGVDQGRDRSERERSGSAEGPGGASGWGSYSRGNDLGRASNRDGNTGSESYGGGGFAGGAGYGSREQQGWEQRNQPNPGWEHRNQQGWEQRNQPNPGWEHRNDPRYTDANERSGAMGDHSLHHGHSLHGAHAYDGAVDHTGRGPKGWTRSDDRIRDDVSEQLARHRAIDASEIEVTVEQGEVTLSGTVADRRIKRMAEDVADTVGGVHEVHNHLRVRPTQGPSANTTTTNRPTPTNEIG